MSQIILITGASSGLGAMAARALARAGHRVFASMCDLAAHDGQPAKALEQLARDEGLQLTPIELDVTSDASVERAVQQILSHASGIDVLVHNAGHMTFGPAEAFTPAQLMQIYDVNVVSTRRVPQTVRNILLQWVRHADAPKSRPCAVLSRSRGGRSTKPRDGRCQPMAVDLWGLGDNRNHRIVATCITPAYLPPAAPNRLAWAASRRTADSRANKWLFRVGTAISLVINLSRFVW